jgi:hypothetical protein
MGDQLVAEAATYTKYNKHKRRTSMPSTGFEPAIPTQSSDYRPTPQTARPAGSAHKLANSLFYLCETVPKCYMKTDVGLEK